MRFLILFLMAFLFMVPAHADNKKETLKELEQRVAAEKKRQAELDKELKKIEQGMKGLKTKLINTTSLVQKNEKELVTLEQKMNSLSSERAEIQKKLDKDQADMAELVIALQRISRLPPQALIARPGAPLETAQASVILGAIMPELNKRADEYKKTLEKLQTVESDLDRNKKKIKSSSERLLENKNKMEELVAQRQDSLKQTQTELEIQQKEVATLSEKATDLKDLISKIELEKERKKRERQRLAELKKQEKSKKTTTQKAPDSRTKKVDESKLGLSLASLGPSQLPTAGTIAIKYGQRDELGASSEGLHIKSRSGASVVAPMTGTVKYAGPFKSYGSIVLLEHKNNYHSLIAGLGRIDTVVGQRLDAGEPIGKLSPKATLYYELRYNGLPINPARKFAGVGG